MKLASPILLILGFCLGTLGAAGFNQVTGATEPNTYLYLGAGVVLILGAGLLKRAAREAGGATGGPGQGLAWFQRSIEGLESRIAELDEHRETLPASEIHARIDALLGGDYFDLTSRHEELVGLVGFGAYAKVWDGVASAERLLARAWSMITDGHDEEGLAELPLARKAIERASRAVASLSPSR